MDNTLFKEDSERAVISILLNNPSKLLETIELKGFMFSSAPHQILFDTIVQLGKEGVQPEPLVLSEYLRVKNKLDLVGSLEYIQHLASKIHDVNNYNQFSSIVMESYKGRSLLGISHQIPEMVKKTSNISSLITQVRDKLGDLLVSIGGDKTISLRDYVRTQYNIIKDRIANPGIRGIPTGFPGIDHALGGAMPGYLILVAARPAMGKTAWMISSALKAKVPSLIFSKEMNRTMIMDRIISLTSGISLFNIRRGLINDVQAIALDKSIVELEKSDVYIDTNYTSDFQYIVNTIRKYHQTHGIESVYVDYVQLVVERDENSTNEIGRVSRMLKLIASELGIVVYLVSQLNRGVESRDDKKPILSDLRQSGNLEEDSDVVIFLYRDDYYNENSESKGVIENIIRKNRNGPTGSVAMRFNPETIELIDDSDDDGRSIFERRVG